MLLGHFQILRIMMYSILIGSYARGDYNANSDCDVVLINNDESNFDKNILSISNKELINFISYDNSQFKSLYDSGSLFITFLMKVLYWMGI
ncbi:nucleotidyltransferase domain-containing protein [Aeromonas veronii]